MEHTYYKYVVIFGVIHVISFSLVSVALYYRVRGLQDEYRTEGRKLELLENHCSSDPINKDRLYLNDEYESILSQLKLHANIHTVKRQASLSLENLVKDLFKAQETILEQHCINNSRLCVYGSKGVRGQKGIQGDVGSKGNSGNIGVIGDPGIPGLKGEQGPSGEEGQVGAIGNPGPQGQNGQTGLKGAGGIPGKLGSKADKGESGLKGQKGERGPLGEKGMKGAQGLKGMKGERGPAGSKGTVGEKGERGPLGAAGKVTNTDCLCKAPEPKKQLRVGDRTTLTCPEAGAQQVAWKKDNSSISARMNLRNNTLIIDSLYPGDGGIYECSARVKVGGRTVTRTHLLKLTVAGGTIYDCDFETGHCQWKERTSDGMDFTRIMGPTGSSNTGPPSDHTFQHDNQGYYLYIETSSSSPGSLADLVSPDFPPDNKHYCLTLWYNMHGVDIKELSVIKEVSGTKSILWNKKLDQGRDWHRAVIDIQGSGQKFNVVIEAERGVSYHGDIAIDDLIVYEGTCSSHNLKQT